MKNTTATKAVRKYVLSVIDFEGTDKEKIEYFFDTFKIEYGYQIKSSKGSIQKCLGDYLRGLPSIINHAFADYEIADLLLSWGYLSGRDSDAKVCRELENYWNRISMALLVIARREGVVV